MRIWVASQSSQVNSSCIPAPAAEKHTRPLDKEVASRPFFPPSTMNWNLCVDLTNRRTLAFPTQHAPRLALGRACRFSCLFICGCEFVLRNRQMWSSCNLPRCFCFFRGREKLSKYSQIAPTTRPCSLSASPPAASTWESRTWGAPAPTSSWCHRGTRTPPASTLPRAL